MDRRPLAALTVLATLALAAPASAQFGDDDEKPSVGVKAGIFMPSDKFIQDVFGKSILTYGLGSVAPHRPTAGTLTPELDFVSASKDGNKLFIGSFTYGYEYHFADDKSNTVPYARVFGGASYFDYGINTVNGRQASKRIGTNFGGEVGIVLGGRLRIAPRYNAYNKQDDFNFNGFNLSATLNILKL